MQGRRHYRVWSFSGKSGGNCFVIFSKQLPANAYGKAGRNFPEFTVLTQLKGPWSVAFDPKWGGPEEVEFPGLISWTDCTEDGIKFYSGKAIYRKTFDLSYKSDERLFLDLGNVSHVAEVMLNGKKLGILWCAPWRVDISGTAKSAGNTLEIAVTNIWANRVIGGLSLPKEKRFTTTHDAFRFDMLREGTPLIESGLLGPVRILKGSL